MAENWPEWIHCTKCGESFPAANGSLVQNQVVCPGCKSAVQLAAQEERKRKEEALKRAQEELESHQDIE